MPDLAQERLRLLTRRHFFSQCRIGLGSLALATFLNDGKLSGAEPGQTVNPLTPKPPHFPARARAVIFLFMAGGPSQIDLFDPKPRLQQLDGQPIPESYIKDKRFAFIRGTPKLIGSKRKFARYGIAGAEITDVLPHLASVADDLAIVRSMVTDVFNHGPAKLFMNTGSPQFGRPSMGAWVTYGIGSESQDLPGFVVLQSPGRGPRGGALLWGSAFLPTTYQGVTFRSAGAPILNLASPKGVSADRQRDMFDTVRELNLARLAETGDPEIATRIASYEMAYRMQSSAPELMDIARETKATLEQYGAIPGQASFANNCLLARRLVERGVRFVQIYHTDWDDHDALDAHLGPRCRDIDRPIAALIRDLKGRGLLDTTLVLWGGEFGRTPMSEARGGRDHHPDAFTMWLAGGGIKAGQTIGRTDELGFNVTEERVHVHDLQATILHLLGLDHTKLTFRFQGRDFRLTDVGGVVVRKLLA
jgi:hypothetical protein